MPFSIWESGHLQRSVDIIPQTESNAAQRQWSSTEARVQHTGRINPGTLNPTYTTKQKNHYKGCLD